MAKGYLIEFYIREIAESRRKLAALSDQADQPTIAFLTNEIVSLEDRMARAEAGDG
jgi:hypothetical protein